jgi:RND family efflux transporter MFP subunit
MTAQIKLSGAEDTYGTLSSIGISADEATRTFTCKVAVANDNEALHPGDFVTVNLYSDTKIDVISIPLQALSGSEGEYSVFVLDNGVAKKVRVTIGKISENRAIITSGLVKDQSVIITNLNVLQDGDVVTVSDEGKKQ